MRRLARIPATPLARATIWAAGIYAIVQGVGIILGGPVRWSGVAFIVLRQVPGAPASWGAAALVFGLLILVGSLRRIWLAKAVGLLGLCAWSLAFAVGAETATSLIATASTTAGPVYLYVAVSTAILIWVDETEPPHDDR